MDKIIKLSPYFKQVIWGGNNIKNIYNKNVTFEKCGESWEVSCHENGLSKVFGTDFTLLDFLKANPDFAPLPFPLLFKIIDANDNLSVQIHPDSTKCKNFKSESWIILNAEKGAGIYAGYKENVTKSDVLKAIENKSIVSLLNFIPVKCGEIYYIEAGTVHAIGKGITIAEIQTASDITYRFYDWDRFDNNGNSRELHIKEAIDAMTNFFLVEKSQPEIKNENDNYFYIYDNSPFYKIENIKIENKQALHYSSVFKIIFIKSGSGQIVYDNKAIEYKMGDSFLISKNLDNFNIVNSDKNISEIYIFTPKTK